MSTTWYVMPARSICAFNRRQYPHHTVLYIVTVPAWGRLSTLTDTGRDLLGAGVGTDMVPCLDHVNALSRVALPGADVAQATPRLAGEGRIKVKFKIKSGFGGGEVAGGSAGTASPILVCGPHGTQ